MKIKFLISSILGLFLTGAIIAGSLSNDFVQTEETIAATSSSKTSIQVWVYDEEKVGTNVIKISSATYDSGYDADDLICWFNNYKGTCSNVHNNNTTAAKDGNSIKVTQKNYASGTHYDRNGRHYNFVLPYFVSKISFSLHKTDLSKQYYSGTIGSRIRRVLGVYDNSGGSGYWSLGGDSSISTSFTQNVITKNVNGVSTTVTRWQYTPFGSISCDDLADKKFAGWYDSSEFVNLIDGGTVITKDTTIFAKFTNIDYIYVAIAGDVWNTGVYAYSWVDGTTVYPHNPWPGTKITTTADDVKFVTLDEVDYGLVRIPVYEDYGDFIIINNGGNGYQTENLKITAGAFYMQDDIANSTGDVKDGAEAAAFVFDFNDARLNVAASGNILKGSICGLDAKYWVDRYDSLSQEAQKRIDKADINTYDPENSEETAHVTFSQIIDYLRTRYSETELINNVLYGHSNNYSTIIIALIITVSLFGLSFVLISKKRKSLSK